MKSKRKWRLVQTVVQYVNFNEMLYLCLPHAQEASNRPVRYFRKSLTKKKRGIEFEHYKNLDAKGFACPMPIVRTKKAIDTINSGEVLEVLVTDKGALNDFPAWAEAGGHTILEQKEKAGVFFFYIQKA